jgi:hypothetical protein
MHTKSMEHVQTTTNINFESEIQVRHRMHPK